MTEEQKRALRDLKELISDKEHPFDRYYALEKIATLETSVTAQTVTDDEVQRSAEILQDMCRGGGIHTEECVAVEIIIRAATTPKPCECDALVEVLENTKSFIERMPKGIGRGAASPLYVEVCQALATHRQNKELSGDK